MNVKGCYGRIGFDRLRLDYKGESIMMVTRPQRTGWRFADHGTQIKASIFNFTERKTHYNLSERHRVLPIGPIHLTLACPSITQRVSKRSP